MNKYEMKGNWNELKGKVKEQWGELTDDDLDRIDGETDQLVGAIQKRYGRSVDEARDDVRTWRDRQGV
jgi:uncharacterized protein YjbJ (UPF0337 family)